MLICWYGVDSTLGIDGDTTMLTRQRARDSARYGDTTMLTRWRGHDDVDAMNRVPTATVIPRSGYFLNNRGSRDSGTLGQTPKNKSQPWNGCFFHARQSHRGSVWQHPPHHHIQSRAVKKQPLRGRRGGETRFPPVPLAREQAVTQEATSPR